MSSERAEEPTTPDNRGGHPGQVLAAQREAMGWTVEQVADQLKLAVRQVVALEAGDYAALPSPAVTRGFVRAYAKLVRVDPAPLVAQIAIDTGTPADTSTTAVRRPSPASFSQAKFPSHGKRSLPLGWIAAVVAVAVAAGAAWHFGLIPTGQHADTTSAGSGSTSAPATGGASSEAASGSSTETLQNPSVPLISVPGPASAPADGAAATGSAGAANAPAAAAPGPVVNTPATTATGAPPTTLPAAPANPVTAASPAAAAGATAPAAAGTLVLTVRSDAWIEVKPAKGAPLIKRLVKAGSTETLTIDQPVRVIVGNPDGVSATLRGAPVALPLVPGKTYSLVNVQ
jgi:cytoskeleton protein RodZ